MNVCLLDEDFVTDCRIGDNPLLTQILQSPFGDAQGSANLLLSQSLVRLMRRTQRIQVSDSVAQALKQGAKLIISSRFDHFTFHNR